MILFREHIIVSLIHKLIKNMIEHYAGLNMNNFNLFKGNAFDAQSLPNQSSQLYDTYIDYG